MTDIIEKILFSEEANYIVPKENMSRTIVMKDERRYLFEIPSYVTDHRHWGEEGVVKIINRINELGRRAFEKGETSYVELLDGPHLDEVKAEIIEGVRKDVEEIKRKEREGESKLRDMVFCECYP